MANSIAVMATPEGAAANPAVDVLLGASPHLIKHLASPGLRLEQRRAIKKDSDTNIQIKVEGEWIQGHASVLGAHCAVIDRAVQDREPPLRLDFDTMKISKPAMDKVFEYAYTGEIRMTRRLLQPVLRAAVRLEVHGLVTLLEEYLIAMSIQIPYSLFALQVGASTPVSDRAVSELIENCCAHFPAMLKEPTFLKLSVESLCMLLCRDSLRDKISESQILLAALDWIYTDQKTQIMHAEKVLSCVRFDNLKLTDIERIMSMAFHISPGSGCTFRVSTLVHNRIAKKSKSGASSPPNGQTTQNTSSSASQNVALEKMGKEKDVDVMVDASGPSRSKSIESNISSTVETSTTESWVTATESASNTTIVSNQPSTCSTSSVSSVQGIPDLPPEPNVVPKLSPKLDVTKAIGFVDCSPKNRISPSPSSKVGIPTLPPVPVDNILNGVGLYPEDRNLVDCPHSQSNQFPDTPTQEIGFKEFVSPSSILADGMDRFAPPNSTGSFESCLGASQIIPNASFTRHQFDYEYDRDKGWNLPSKISTNADAMAQLSSTAPKSNEKGEVYKNVLAPSCQGAHLFTAPVTFSDHFPVPISRSSRKGEEGSSKSPRLNMQYTGKADHKTGNSEKHITHFYQECKVYADRVTKMQGLKHY